MPGTLIDRNEGLVTFRRSLLASLPSVIAAVSAARAQGAPFSFRESQSGTDGGVSVELITLIARQPA